MDNYNRVIYTTPYDSEVEYLESTGTQWIDSGVAVSNTTGMEVEAQKTVANNSDSFACGIRKASRYFNVDVNHYNNNTNGILYVGFGNSQHKQVSRVHLSKFKVAVNANNSRKIMFYDTTESWNLPSDISVDGNIYVFASLGAASNRWKGRIYYLKIYDNTTLVRDFIPVRVGNIGYMYDRVSKQLFANKGTGNFILGQDVANLIPNIRRVFRFGNKRFVMPMPYDSRVEYLESTGTQWIDTGVLYRSNVGIECEVAFTDTVNNNVAFRNFITNGIIGLLIWGNKIVAQRIVMTNNGVVNITADTNFHIIKNYPTYCKIDNNQGSVSGEFIYDGSNTIELYSQKPQRRLSRLKIKYFKIYQDTSLVRDLIPVRIGTKGYMYDKVSGKLFGNSGTGQFILGQDIND